MAENSNPHSNSHRPIKLFAKTEVSHLSSGLHPPIHDSVAAPSHRKLSLPDTTLEPVSDILHIIPLNHRAKLAFSDLARNKGTLDKHHAQYIHITGDGLLSKKLNNKERSSGETTDDMAEDTASKTQILEGYFRVNLAFPSFSRGAKWVLGRGSGKKHGAIRNVDILLAKPGGYYTGGLIAAHAFIQMHEGSGFWMVRAALDNHPCDERKEPPVLLDDEELQYNEIGCLSESRKLLQIAGLQFWIQFAISDPKQESRYLVERNQLLNDEKMPIPDTRISGIPFSSDLKLAGAAWRHGLGSGSFGSVYEGVDMRSGNLRAIKHICIKDATTIYSVRVEISANEKLNGAEGIVKLFDWSTSLASKDIDANMLPLDVYLVMEKGVAFSRYKWQEEIHHPWTLGKVLLRQLLSGLVAIHDRAWIHRDITPMNILYFPDEPKHAALFDFGKLHTTGFATETALAGWQWLPPEIHNIPGWRRNVYDQKIDVWMLAEALVWVWFRDARAGLSFRDKSQHSQICDNLLKKELGPSLSLPVLLRTMLSWEPRARPTAREALAHPCFNDIMPTFTEEMLVKEGKKRVGEP